ncbi:MAG: hypothetical protein IKQ71_00370 [Lachnospiraceae bacterium]|nr:hypothetical protein [Lachnospiraceae bacterium]
MPKPKIKELDLNKRVKYRSEVAKIIAKRDERFDLLFSMFAPDGKLPEGFNLRNEFNSIEVPLPVVEGMSPEDSKKLATAIIIGSMLNPKKLSGEMTSSSPMGDQILFNQQFILDNIVRGEFHRQGNFPPVMVQAKLDAAEAIKNLNNGDPTEAKRMLDDLIEFGAMFTASNGLARSDTDVTAELVYFPSVSAVKLGFDQIGKEPVNAEGPTYDPVVDIHKKVGIEISHATDRVFDIKNRLLTEDIAAGSDERRELVENLLFDQYIMNLSIVEYRRRTEQKEKYVEAIAKKIGYGEDNQLYGAMNYLRTPLEAQVDAALKTNTVSDIQVILSKEGGYDKLRAMYMESIRKSELYQKMVESNGDVIIDAMNYADKEIPKASFYEFPKVKTGGVSKAINEKNKDKLKTALKEAENNFFNTLDDEMNKQQINSINADDYGIDQFDSASLERNEEIVGDMFDLIDKVDHSYIRSSKNFRDMKKSLSKLKEMAEKATKNDRNLTPQEIKKYNDLIKQTDELAKTYLENKTDSSSDYAKSRMAAVFELRRRLKVHSKKITDIYGSYKKKKTDEIENYNTQHLGKMFSEVNKREFFNPVADKDTDPYRQGKYKGKALGKPDLSAYSTDRTATHSIALMKLAAEVDSNGKPKYTIDQLMNPYELKKEKSAAYDETAKWILDYSYEGDRWIATNMYKGLKNLKTQIDDYAKKIDFTSDGYMDTPEYRKLQQLTFQIFDIEQEMAHCQSEIMDIAGAEHPELKNFNQLKDVISPLKGPLASEGGYFKTIKLQGDALYRNFEEKDQMQFINAVLSEGIIKKIMADAQKNNIPYTKIFGTVDQDKSFNIMLAYIGVEHMDLYDPDLIKYAGTKLLDGSICKDIKVTFNPDEPDFSKRYKVTGIPSLEQLKNDHFYETVSPEALKALRAKNIGVMNKRMAKETPEKRQYTDKAITALRELTDFVVGEADISADNRKVIIRYIKDIVAEKNYETFVKDGLKGHELNAAMERSLVNIPEVKALEEGYIGIGDLGIVLFGDGDDRFSLSSVKATYNMMADDAIARLNDGNYLTTESLIKDASIAMTGKLYQEKGKLPTNPKTKKPYSFMEYAKTLAKEPSFTATINKGKGLDEAGKIFARVAGDRNQLKAMLQKTNVVGQNLQAQNANKNVNKNVSAQTGMNK